MLGEARLWEAGLIALYREIIAKREKAERDWHDSGLELLEGQHQALCSVVSLMSQRIADIEEMSADVEPFGLGASAGEA